MGGRPGQDVVDHGPLGTAVSTTIRGNATAFGFSITITATFGMLQSLIGSPSPSEILLFAVAAAATVGVLEGAVTSGFRRRAGAAPPEVRMMGTALDFISVTVGIGAAAGVGSVAGGTWAWPLAAAAATLAFLVAESAETLAAELIQRRRGDTHADEERDRD